MTPTQDPASEVPVNPTPPPSGLFLAKIFGIPVYAEGSFLIILALFIFTPSGGENSPIVGFIYVLLLFLSILLHEFGHALAARQAGVGTEKITLGMLGGIAHLKAGRMSNLQDLWMTVAGPLVNVVIWLVCLAIEYAVANDVIQLNSRYFFWLRRMESINLGLLFFNLLPGWPLDGGRILVCLLRFFMKQERALLVASYIAQVTAAGLILTAIMAWQDRGGFVMFRILIAISIWQSAANLRSTLRQPENGWS